jgi:hypothetical protein
MESYSEAKSTGGNGWLSLTKFVPRSAEMGFPTSQSVKQLWQRI